MKEKSKKIPVVIPYVKGFSEQMRQVYGKYGIPTYFKPTNTLRQLLVKPKDPLSKENVVGPVYKIKCEECDAVYVGETERSLKVRFSEHRRPSLTPRRFPNTPTWITPNIPWSWIIRRYWQQNPDGLREEWKRPYTSEPSTQASTEMEEGIIYHRYGTTSSRREWRQTGRGGGGASSSPSRTASQTTSPGRLNWWSWQPSGKALVSWFYIIPSIKCTKNCVMTLIYIWICDPINPNIIYTESLMAEWLEQESHWHEKYCHDVKVMNWNPGRVELGAHSTSLESMMAERLEQATRWH